MNANGRHKVMFDSNYPMLTPEACLKDLDLLGLEPEIRELFLGKHAGMRIRTLGPKVGIDPKNVTWPRFYPPSIAD